MALSQITTECRRYGCMKNLLACFANCRYNTRCVELRNEIEDKTEQAASDINGYLAEKSVPPIRIQLLTKGLKFIPLSKIEKPKPERKIKSSSGKKTHTVQSQPAKPLSAKKPKVAQSQPAKKKVIADGNNLHERASVAVPRSGRVTRGGQRRSPLHAFENRPKLSAKLSNDKKPQAVQSQHEKTLDDKKPKVAQSQHEKRKISRKRKPMSRKANTIQNQSNDMPVTHLEGAKENNPKSARSLKPASKARSNSTARNGKKSGKKLYIIIENETATVLDEQGLIKRILAGPSSKARFFEAKEVEAQLQIVYKK